MTLLLLYHIAIILFGEISLPDVSVIDTQLLDLERGSIFYSVARETDKTAGLIEFMTKNIKTTFTINYISKKEKHVHIILEFLQV